MSQDLRVLERRRGMRRTWLLLTITLVSCAGARLPTAPPATGPLNGSNPRAAVPPAPIGTQSGPLVVADLVDERVAVVADEDPPSLRLFDPRSGDERWSTPLEGSPGHVIATRDGRVFVAMRGLDRVDVIRPRVEDAPTPFAKTCVEPIGLALSADEATLQVACGWGHELVAISMQEATMSWRVDLALEPRAAIATAGHVVVSHASGGRASVVDVTKRAAVRVACKHTTG